MLAMYPSLCEMMIFSKNWKVCPHGISVFPWQRMSISIGLVQVQRVLWDYVGGWRASYQYGGCTLCFQLVYRHVKEFNFKWSIYLQWSMIALFLTMIVSEGNIWKLLELFNFKWLYCLWWSMIILLKYDCRWRQWKQMYYFK
jgi:hypothetical protein